MKGFLFYIRIEFEAMQVLASFHSLIIIYGIKRLAGSPFIAERAFL